MGMLIIIVNNPKDDIRMTGFIIYKVLRTVLDKEHMLLSVP
jgi:hypothetical protein